MKTLFIIMVALQVSAVWAKDRNLHDFNHMLINKVQKDLEEDNAEEFKKRKVMERRPASVEGTAIEPEQKIHKQHKQLGSPRW